MKRTTLIVLLIGVWAMAAEAQVGRSFWFAVPEMAQHSKDMSLRLYIAAAEAETDVTIDMPANEAFEPIAVHVDSVGFEEIVLAADYATFMRVYAAPYNQVSNRALHISATEPVSAYIQMTGVNSETYTLKAETALGEDFRLAGQNKYRNSNAYPNRVTYQNAYSSAQIVATEDNTTVTIDPTQLLFGDTQVQTRIITLNRGEVYSFRADSKKAESHIAGTHISSYQPIVVHTMDDSMSPYQQFFGEDAVADQLVPTALLDTMYIAIGRGLHWEGVCITDPETGHTEFRPMGDQPTMVIRSEKPVQVFQISGHRNEAGGTQLPALRFGSHITKYKRLADSRWCWIHVLTKTDNIANMTIDDTPIADTAFHAVTDAPEWSYAVLPVTEYDKNKVITVRSSGDRFHLSAIDASSAKQTKDGRDVPTSCSFGYFSHYGAEPMPVEEIEIDSIVEDTVVTVDTLKTDSVVKKLKKAHRIMLYVEGAYSHIPLNRMGDFRWGLGYGAGAGLLYEYQHKHFLFDVGVGFLWQDVASVNTTDITRNMTDTQGTPCTVQMRRHRTDRSRLGYVEVPILFGGTWDAFYLLGGVKVGVPLFGHTQSEMKITDVAMYNRYFVPFDDMTNHGLRTDVPLTQRKERIDYKVDTRLSLELGANLDVVRLGIYAEYGVLLMPYTGTGTWLDDTNFMQVEQWDMTHPLNSTMNTNYQAHNFFAGIKVTIPFTVKAEYEEEKVEVEE
jgi:hypothetical protein